MNPNALVKNKNEYYVYNFPWCTAKYGNIGPKHVMTWPNNIYERE